MKHLAKLAIGSILLAATPAVAQTAPQAAPAAPAPAAAQKPTVGASVFGPDGVEIGKVESLTADAAVLTVGSNRVPVPFDRFSTAANGFNIAITRSQLESALSQAQNQSAAAVKEKLVAGADVRGSGGTVLGKVKEVGTTSVTVTTANGEVAIPSNAFQADAGGLSIPMSADDFAKAVAAGK